MMRPTHNQEENNIADIYKIKIKCFTRMLRHFTSEWTCPICSNPTHLHELSTCMSCIGIIICTKCSIRICSINCQEQDVPDPLVDTGTNTKIFLEDIKDKRAMFYENPHAKVISLDWSKMKGKCPICRVNTKFLPL